MKRVKVLGDSRLAVDTLKAFLAQEGYKLTDDRADLVIHFGEGKDGHTGSAAAPDIQIGDQLIRCRRNGMTDVRPATTEDLLELLQTSPGVVREAAAAYSAAPRLTPREGSVASLLAQGHSNRTIAALTGLREQSVKNVVSGVMRKLGCRNRVQAALRLRRDLVTKS